MRHVDAGEFMMGSSDGQADEQPVHRVRLTTSLYISAIPITNAWFEQYDPTHHAQRGRNDLSHGDDDAVVYVSWRDAVGFCDWLSQSEGRSYRLPTESEWEYACRAGTTTAYNTGEQLPETYHRAQCFGWRPQAVETAVGRTPANAWGLCDMHGLIEEWCQDWYGPYPGHPVQDPAGPDDGEYRVTRGGSHNTDAQFLRSASRFAAIPEERCWAIGFRVVQAQPTLMTRPRIHVTRRWQQDVRPIEKRCESNTRDNDAPRFDMPVAYVIPHEPDANEPVYRHNHCPSITHCDNGDLLAIWFSTINESGREMVILGSRKRAGNDKWDAASVFFNVPGRNLTGTSLYNDGKGTLWHFNSIGVTEGWSDLALALRTSHDHGVTWSKPHLINPWHGDGNQVISGTSVMPDGTMVQPCDAVWSGSGGSIVHTSNDGGQVWTRPGLIDGDVTFKAGETGPRIAGIHAGVLPLHNGSLMAFGRSDNLDGRMPMSISYDHGKTWTYQPSAHPPISDGQRLVLMRLREGPILLVSFTDESPCWPHPRKPHFPERQPVGVTFEDRRGRSVRGYGMYAALSYDEGATWPVKKLLSPFNPFDGAGSSTDRQRTLDGGGWTGPFTLGATTAEPKGYLAATQSPDGVIHLISSRLHYQFNTTWIQTPWQ